MGAMHKIKQCSPMNTSVLGTIGSACIIQLHVLSKYGPNQIVTAWTLIVLYELLTPPLLLA